MKRVNVSISLRIPTALGALDLDDRMIARHGARCMYKKVGNNAATFRLTDQRMPPFVDLSAERVRAVPWPPPPHLMEQLVAVVALKLRVLAVFHCKAEIVAFHA
jgi:hypothetical protein